MNRAERARVLAEAVADAELFASEFPGELLDPAQTDWDATAWAQAPSELQTLAGAWELYQSALIAAVARRCTRKVQP